MSAAVASLLGCGVDDREPDLSDTPPPFSSQLPGSGEATPVTTAPAPDMTANTSPEPGAAVDPAPASGSEGPPNVTDLDPSEPAASDGADGEAAPPEEPPAPPVEEEPAEPLPPVEPEPPPAGRTQVFILFGQSNMWGVPNPQAQDLEINPRVEVLTNTSCGRHGTNQWVPAQPPLHGCVGQAGNGTNGPGVGPGDYFAKTLAEAFPEDTILLVPNAIPGVSIDVFQPGQQAYDSMLARSRMAQERGEIRGIIFHQGETDSGQTSWPGRVRTVVDRLRSDLGIGEVPFVAGELFYGCPCSGHNTLVNQLPSVISNAFVVRADAGFAALPNDGFGNLHFDLAAQRTFGRRYGEAMLGALAP